MTGLGNEYGEALYELGRDENILPEMHQEFSQIHELLVQSPEFVRLLSSHAIEREVRLKVLDETFGGRANPYLVNFMKLLVEKERFHCIDVCWNRFHQMYKDEFGIVEAWVTSAVALSESDMDALRRRLEQISGKKVVIIPQVDAALIGGVRVEMNGKRYDNTIQNRLGRLRRSLIRGV